MGLMESLRAMRDDTLLRSMQQRGGVMDGADQIPPSSRPSGIAGLVNPVPSYMPKEFARGYGSGYNKYEDIPTTNLLNIMLEQQKRALPGQKGVAPGSSMSPTPPLQPSVDPASGGLKGLSMQDFAKAHGQEIGPGNMASSINNAVSDEVKEAQALKNKNTVSDFLKGLGASEEKRASSQYNPNFAGIKGFGRDLAKGLQAIPEGEKARTALALDTAFKIQEAKNKQMDSQAKMITAKAAIKTADNALEKLAQENEHFRINTSRDERKLILETVKSLVENRTTWGRPVEEDDMRKFIQIAIQMVSDITGNKALKKVAEDDEAGQSVRDAITKDPTISKGTQAPSSARPSRTVDELLNTLNKPK